MPLRARTVRLEELAETLLIERDDGPDEVAATRVSGEQRRPLSYEMAWHDGPVIEAVQGPGDALTGQRVRLVASAIVEVPDTQRHRIGAPEVDGELPDVLPVIDDQAHLP